MGDALYDGSLQGMGKRAVTHVMHQDCLPCTLLLFPGDIDTFHAKHPNGLLHQV